MFKIVKRADISRKQKITFRIVAVLLALATSAVFLILMGRNPLAVYFSMLNGSFGTAYRLKETIIKTIPLVITSLGISVAFRMRFWNIGAEGQMLMGAFLGSFFALNYSFLPKPILLIVMLVAGCVAGGIWALIPAFFKSRFGTNETLVTLMMNYIALKWVMYLQYGPWRDPKAKGFPKIPNFTDNAILPKLFGIHIGWVMALVLIVIMYVFIHHSKKGFEISVIGESENTARYAGMSVGKVILTAIFISGALGGLSGIIQASAVSNTLSVEVAGGVGYTAIITTWLSQLSAPYILVVSFLFAVLLQGGSFIQTAFQIPQSAAQIMQGMILFFVLGSEFFVQYRLTRVCKLKTISPKQEVECK